MLNNPAARRVMSVVIEPTARLMLRLHVSPDAVTVFGTAAVVAVALICLPQGLVHCGGTHHSRARLQRPARRHDGAHLWHVRSMGNFLDATLDRIGDGAIFGGLALYGAFNDRPWSLPQRRSHWSPVR